jgi:hypothetical protein
LIANMLGCATKASPSGGKTAIPGFEAHICECYAVVKKEYDRFPGRQRVLRARVGRGKLILRADIALLVSRAA